MGRTPPRPLHPVVDGYINGEAKNLLDMLRRQREPRDPLVQAILRLREALGGIVPLDACIREAESAPVEKAEPNLHILFLSCWSQVSYKLQRVAEAWATLRRAQALVTDRTPLEIRAHLMVGEAFLLGAEGNVERRETLFNNAVRLLPEKSPRRKTFVWSRAIFLARLGRAVEVEEDLAWLASLGAAAFPPTHVALARFTNAVETGRAEEAGLLQAEFGGDPGFEGGAARWRRGILDLMRKPSAPDLGISPEIPAESPERRWHEMARVLRLLEAGRPAEALLQARQALARAFNPDVTISFMSYNQIRVELASGHAEAAQRLLERRWSRGNRHYLDDFFLARAALLTAKGEAAAGRLAAAIRSAKRYGAEGRLNYEIRLSCEISREEALRLGMEAARILRTSEPGPAFPGPGAEPAPRGQDRLVGRSAALTAIRATIARFAPLDVPVLVTGETGTGKEVVARALHEAGPRGDRPFLAVNCGAIAETLLETELFGHEKGAFTGAERAHRGFFEEAGGGTVFLDEIGEISPRLQVMLLRVLETGEIRPVGAARTRGISCRILAATNAPLDRLVEEGRFRKDLLFRLRRLSIEIPPLRERREDILPLADHFLAVGRKEDARVILTAELKEALQGYDWPGNVRELRNEIERMRLMTSDGLVYRLLDADPRIRGSFSAARGAASGMEAAAGEPEEFGTEAPGVAKDREGSGRRETGGGGPTRPGRGGFNAAGLGAGNRPESGAGGEGGSGGIQGPPAGGEETWENSRVAEILGGERSGLRRRERLKEIFRRNPRLTRGEVAKIIEVSFNTATADLKALVEGGFIRRVEPNRSPRTHYFELRQAPTP